MIDGIVDSFLDAASPIITKWRSAFVFASLILSSSGLSGFLNKNFYTLTIKNFVSLLADMLYSSSVLYALFFSLIFYFLAPYLNSYLLRFFVSKNIVIAKPMMEEIDKLKNMPNKKIENIIEKSFSDKKSEAISSTKLIAGYREKTEIIGMAWIMCLILSIHLHIFNSFIVFLSGTLYIFIVYSYSKRVLIAYLKNIAPFKVLENYVKDKVW